MTAQRYVVGVTVEGSTEHAIALSDVTGSAWVGKVMCGAENVHVRLAAFAAFPFDAEAPGACAACVAAVQEAKP